MDGIIFILILLVLMVPLFLTTRRQKKMMRQTQETQASLAVGDEVMTTSGMHAEVAGLQEATVDLEIAPGVITRWERIAIRERLTGDAAEDVDAGYDQSDGDDVQDGFTEEDIEGFSADQLTPEDFAGDAQGDEARRGSDRDRRRDGDVAES
ncbi:preprotein translocase subunit YajC [Tomitella fengzijianii]|uniref:Preprotein translocase subunit YajC n=1 Tax=Tomitella fengzijianii TaxID=2597660 RepID=A0A516X3H2_9ACTN|nr:preprotein translocase subunit YajC [Tomitella fengzijianii]QDQ97563.1 preprotein translocase subunit YajC [Tomitella fengzijianii]